MKNLFNVVVVICAASLICSLVTTFVTDGSIKKIVNLVLGAFIICSMIVPVKNAVSSFGINVSEYQTAEEAVSSSDEAYSNALVNQTKENLESAATDLLLQNGIKINYCKIILAVKDENRIIISSISIYIDKDDMQYADTIEKLISDNFGIVPQIMTE
jgi:hypothetical protein